MSDIIHRHYAQAAFDRSLKRGKRDTNLLSRLRRMDNRALELSQVLENIRGGGEAHVGVQEVQVDRIVGTENRGDDFSRSFHPTKRWLGHRWMQVYNLMAKAELQEPISVIEVGGSLFVRDGHHRVSVARALNVEYLSASITRYTLPFRLPRDMDRNSLPLLRAKAQFHANTGVFGILDEEEFFVACAKTWKWLETEICQYNRSWFVRRFDREPVDLAEQLTVWYENLYHNAIDFIRRNSLAYLFPGKRETDIFVEMIRLWNSYDNPDEIWLGEIYNEFVARRRRERFLRTPVQALASAAGKLVKSAEDEYRQFAAISQIEELVPAFRPLPKEKGFYRFLYRELVHRYAPALKPQYGRAPYIQELTPRWYKDFYAPVAKYALMYPSAPEQTQFYIRFSRRHLSRVLAGETDLCAALQHFTSADAP